MALKPGFLQEGDSHIDSRSCMSSLPHQHHTISSLYLLDPSLTYPFQDNAGKTTLLYRLNHIKSILRCDLNDADARLLLMLSFKLLEGQ